MDDFPAPGALPDPLPDPLPARSRGNGLPGKHFVPLLAVDARATTDVLATLATASIAAYARPRTATTDEVYSDAGRRADARSLLAVRLPEVLPPTSDGDQAAQDAEKTDAAFAEIVANWDPAAAETEPPATVAPATPAPDIAKSSDDSAPEIDEDHYVPPPAPPLPRLAPVTRWALIAVFAGIVALVLPLLIGLNAPAWLCTIAVAAIVGGGGVMIARMGNDPHDGDDGAVV